MVNFENPRLAISSEEIFQHILPYDGTVEVIGIVAAEYAPICVKTDVPTLRFKGVLTNGKWKVQITVWGKDIEHVEPLFKINNVTQVNGAFAQERRKQFSLGNVSIDLTYKSNTKIRVLRTEAEESYNYIPVHISRVLEYDKQYIVIRGFVNSEFVQDSFKGVRMAFGSITTDRVRLEVRSSDVSFVGKFPLGSKVEVRGYMKGDEMPFYITVNSSKHITIISDIMIYRAELRRAALLPQKRKAKALPSTVVKVQATTDKENPLP